MPTLPRLKNSDNLNQWSSKVNEGFEQLEIVGEGALTTVAPFNAGEFIVYWGQYSLTNTNKAFGTHYNTDAPYQNLGDLTVTIPSDNQIVRDITITDAGISYSAAPTITFSNPYVGSTGFPGATGTTINSVVGSTGFASGTIVSSAFAIPGATGVSYKFYKATTAIANNSIVPLHSNGLANNWLFIGRNARATVTVGSGNINGKTVVDGGYGYSSLPSITITPTSGGTGAVLTPQMYSDVVASLTVGSIENKSEITSLTDTTRATDYLLVYDSSTLKKVKISTITPDVPTGAVLFGSPTDSYTWDTTNLYWDDTNNRLGLGTTSPDALLTVSGVGAFGDGATGFPSITNTGDLDTGFWFPLSNTIAASTAGVERVRITSTGEIGIGTISPDALLTVAGVGAFGDGSASAPSITNTGDLDTGFWFPLSNTIAASTAGVERVRIDSSGNVAIGTSTTSNGTFAVLNNSDAVNTFLNLTRTSGGSADGVYILDERGTSGVNSGKSFRVVTNNNGLNDTGAIASFETVGGASNTVLRVGMDYNVGIGTSTPAYALDIKSLTGGVALRITNAGASDNVQIRFQGNQSNVEQWAIGNEVSTNSTGRNFDIYDMVSAQNRLRIDSSGNIGIGATSPAYKLDVVGDTNISTGSVYRINGTSVLSSTTLGSGITTSSLTSVGTITTGTWNATVITGQYGGTGVNNAGKTITLGGNLITSGAFALTLTLSNITNVTLPVTGTLATLAGSEALTNKTYNNINITAPASTATLTLGSSSSLTLSANKSLNISNSLTFTGTDSSTVAFGSGGTVLYTSNSINIGTTSIPLNRSSASQTLTGISIDGNAATATRLSVTKNITFAGNVSGVLSTDFSGDSTVTIAVNTATSATSAVSVIGPVLSGTGTHDLVYGTMADNDFFRIRVSGTSTNSGFVEFATADDGSEPIYFSQYSGVFTTLVRTATILDASGNTSFPGIVAANTFSGSGASLTSIPNSAVGAVSTNTSSAIVARDASGNFFAGTVTATLNGNATTATTLQTSRNFTLTGNVTSDTVSFNGSAVVSLTTTIGAGVVTNTMLAGSIANNKLVNSSITINGTSVSLGGSITVASVGGSNTQVQYNSSGTLTGSANFTFDGTRATVAALTVDINSGTDPTLFVDATNNRIGIGTSTPSQSLHIIGTVLASSFSGSGASLTSIPNSALVNSTISGISLGSNLATLTIGSFLTGGSYNGSSAVTIAVNASTSGTSNVVARDVSGNFSAGTITASLSGNATTATTATSISGQANSATITATASNIGNQIVLRDVSGNFSAGTITAGLFSGSGASLTSIPNSATTATSANTANAIVTRDVSGNFSAGTITASLSGNASTATTASNISGQANSATITATASNIANQIVLRDGNGDFSARYINSTYFNSIDDINPSSITHIMAKFGDNYLRSATAAKVASFINGQTMNINGQASTISGQANSATITASSTNSASQIVLRDSSGNFSAGTITANLSGNATTATTATNLSGGSVTATTGSFSGRIVASASQSTALATSTGSLGGIEVYGGSGTNAAFMTFHRPGAYAVYFGLDGTDLKVGGWSMGAVAYTILTENNWTSYTSTKNIQFNSLGVGTSAPGTSGQAIFTGRVSGSGSSYRLVIPVGTNYWAT
jgi:hypothetical protein